MSTAAVERPKAVVPPFVPVEQGRILPCLNNTHQLYTHGQGRRSSSSPSAAAAAPPEHHFHTTSSSSAASSNSSTSIRRSSSSSDDDDEETEKSGTWLTSGGDSRSPFDEVDKSAAKRLVGKVIPLPRHRTTDRERLEPVRRSGTVSTSTPITTDLPYYHGQISSAEAKCRLRNLPPGTFLLRDSQSRDPQFPFAISVVVMVTSDRRQVQSIRVSRCQLDGKYSLDCAEDHRSTMPRFRSVGSLVDFLMTSSSTANDGAEPAVVCVLVDRRGGMANQLLLLTEALPRQQLTS